MPDAYPLEWPAGYPRTRFRQRSRFKASPGFARDEIFEEIRRLGGTNVVLSTNVRLRQDGRPYANEGSPTDPGVAVYFNLNKKPICLACDQYERLWKNQVAISKTIEAMRGIDRWGCSDMLNRMFTGFAQLPAPMTVPRAWWEILGVSSDATREQIREAATALARRFHPDTGGSEASHSAMAEVNAAKEQGLREATR
jgi:hypothetical protein